MRRNPRPAPRAGHIAAALALVLCAAPLWPQDCAEAFGRRYEESTALVLSRASTWCARLRGVGADPSVLIPVVFPELLRASSARSGLEYLGLGTLYVAKGHAAADFSVGRFQMKPSFIESLEAEAARLPGAPPDLLRIAEYPVPRSVREERVERLRRLRSEDWQLLYLACFYRVEVERFHVESLPIRERIRFLSSAYNHGFLRPRAEIEAAGRLRLFPGGGMFGTVSPWRYGDVAVDFYDRLWGKVAGGDDGPGGTPGP